MNEAKATQVLIIVGSARKDSDTRKLVDHLFSKAEVKVLDLLDYKITHYSYANSYPPDDAFQEIVTEVLAARVLVFATPVYWYSMSGLMKVFFDRLTDLVTVRKALGRQLKGKKVFLLACGNDDVLPEGFEVPFKLSSQYLDMDYEGSYYCAAEALQDFSLPAATDFQQKVLALAGMR